MYPISGCRAIALGLSMLLSKAFTYLLSRILTLSCFVNLSSQYSFLPTQSTAFPTSPLPLLGCTMLDFSAESIMDLKMALADTSIK